MTRRHQRRGGAGGEAGDDPGTRAGQHQALHRDWGDRVADAHAYLARRMTMGKVVLVRPS